MLNGLRRHEHYSGYDSYPDKDLTWAFEVGMGRVYLWINMQMGIGTARGGEQVVTPDLAVCDSALGELRLLAGGGWDMPAYGFCLFLQVFCMFLCDSVYLGASSAFHLLFLLNKATLQKPQSLHFTYCFSWEFAFCSLFLNCITSCNKFLFSKRAVIAKAHDSPKVI